MLPKDIKCDEGFLVSLTLDVIAAIKKHNCLLLYLVLLVLLVMNLSICTSF